MLDDGIINVEQWLAGKVADKFARDEATAFISGDGVGKPTGILANVTASTDYDGRNVQSVNSGTSGEFTYDGLVSVQNALKEAYQGNATWLLKRASLGEIMKIKTTDGEPIFNMQYNKNTGLETSLLSRPLRFADDMPAVGADALSAAYGDFRNGYLIVDRIGIRVLRDPYSAKPYVQFYSTKRVGGDVVNAEAIKLLKLSA
jgi:HK97 family phage major capsid protein